MDSLGVAPCSPVANDCPVIRTWLMRAGGTGGMETELNRKNRVPALVAVTWEVPPTIWTAWVNVVQGPLAPTDC